MISKNYKIITIANLVLVIGLAAMYFVKAKKSNVAYVEISSLYRNFKMTKEFETRFSNVTNSRKTFLDSLEIQLRTLSQNEKKQEEFEQLKNAYIAKKQQFEEDNSLMNKQFNEQIMNQLNQYITEYGKEESFDFIFGANGNGGIMYANEKAFNVTDEVLSYVNKKYAGKLN